MKALRLNSLDRLMLVAWALLILLLGITFAGWYSARLQARELMLKRFEARQAEIVASLQTQIQVFEQILRGGLGLLGASDAVSRAQWHDYVSALQLPRHFPGAQGVGYAKLLTATELPDFLARVRRGGAPRFRIAPAAGNELYAPILYLEPQDPPNLRALGFDMWSEPARRAAMQQARDTAAPVVTGKVRLVQDSGIDASTGFLMYLPYYGRNPVPASVEGRRRLIEGYVYSPFRMDQFMAGVLRGSLDTIRLQVFSGMGLSAETLLYDSHPGSPLLEASASGLTRAATLEIDGQIWTARFTALPAFLAGGNESRPLLILLGGSVISFLVFGILRGIAGRRRAEDLNAQLGRIIEESVSEVYVFDAASLRFLLVNRGARENLGYTADELTQLTPADVYLDFNRARFEQIARPLRVGSAQRQLTWEATLIRKDGSTYAAEIHLQLAPFARPPSFIAIVLDITDRRQAEAQQQLLMDELNHRVKNTLATVQSLATQTLRTSASPADFTESIKGRLAALATSHTLLTRTNWQGTRLKDLVAQQLAPFGSAAREVTIGGDEVFLKPAAALAFGMVLHELTINAVKYGALSVPTGQVSVTWTVEGGAYLVVSWVESGGPLVAKSARKGFGRRMIEQGLTYELRGKVTLDFAPGGLRARMQVPLTPELGEVQRPLPETPVRRQAAS